jgi:hypothetical protein
MNIFYQLIGFGALIAMGRSYWQDDKRTILLWQVAGIASGLSWLVYVIAVRSYSGMVTESVLTIITAASLLKKESRKS